MPRLTPMSDQMELRICTKCSVPKEHSEYYKDSRGSFGLKSWCKVCHIAMGTLNRKSKPDIYRQKVKEWQRKNPEKVRQATKKSYYKKKEENPDFIKEYYAKNKSRLLAQQKEWRKNNRKPTTPEQRAKQKAYRDAHKEEAKEYKKIWHAQNKDRLNKKSREYAEINKPKRKEYLKEYLPRRRSLHKERFQTDLVYRVTTNLRTCITRAFKIRQGWGKLGKSEEILGGKYEVVMKHIEDQLHDGMTWDNYGAGHGCWNIDHRIPLASAKTVEEVKALCHYTNLQPLWFIDNARKQDKMPEEWEAMQK